MSEIRFLRVVSCSGEDTGYWSSNLLKASITSGKWRCKAGEKNGIVLLQLQESSKIRKVDIGNNGSAFIELLVGKSSVSISEFTVLLPSSSFMSPVECKVPGSGNVNRVRTFNSDKLINTVADDTWDLLKIVCTQPFNKTIPFGISFLKVYGENSGSGNMKFDEVQKSTINFPSSLSQPISISKDVSSKFSQSSIQKVKPSLTRPEDSVEEVKCPVKRQEISVEEVKRPVKRPSMKNEKSVPDKKSKYDVEVNHSKPMDGVVFVLSGFQNPDRGDLRKKAIELGARYEADWNSKCTHLVCAFSNTPKFNQVKGKGKIVTKKWIEDCYDQHRLLNWERYNLESKASSVKKCHRENESDAEATLTDYLPDIFSGRTFYIHNSVETSQQVKLGRLIVAYGGEVHSHISSKAEFMIADDDADISQYESDHPELIFVRPEWPFACQKKQKFLPYDQFTL